MKTLFFLFLLPAYFLCTAFTFPPQEIRHIGEKIWKNECGKTIMGLTYWKSGETFASLGIGHFIWYPANERNRFLETFPDLLAFFESYGITIPLWLQESNTCPWSTKEEFDANINHPKMLELRCLLCETIDLQALYIAIRLENALPKIVANLNEEDRRNVERNFYELASTSRGLYALMDYVNFKGEGTAPLESYNGAGWGLLQVLLKMPIESTDPLLAFVDAATCILYERVNNSPIERNEKQWLAGWLSRINSYLSFE